MTYIRYLAEEGSLQEHEHQSHLLKRLLIGLAHILKRGRHGVGVHIAGQRTIFSPSYAYEGCFGPFVGMECHAAHHLCGRHPLISASTIHLEQKLLAHGAHGCHTSVPYYLFAFHHVCLFAADAGECGCGMQLGAYHESRREKQPSLAHAYPFGKRDDDEA